MIKANNVVPDFRLNNFDLIRIVTAFLVLINHSLAHLKLPVPFLYSIVQQFQRVPMFFVMSGFLLSASFERNSNLRQYFRNRFMRIYPGLWVCLLVTIILFALIADVNFYNREFFPWIIAQFGGLIYTPEFMTSFGYGSYNGSLWTIVVELQFYLVLPIIYYLYKKINPVKTTHRTFLALFAAAALVAFMIRIYFPVENSAMAKMLRYSFLPHAYIFMTGILLQRFKVWQWKLVRGKALHWMTVFLLYVYLVPKTDISIMGSMVLLAFCTISLGYSLPGCAAKLLNGRDISYGVYMYHGMILTILVDLNITGSVYWLLFVAAATFAFAWLSYKFIEAPAMAIAKRLNKQPDQNMLTPVHNYFMRFKNSLVQLHLQLFTNHKKLNYGKFERLDGRTGGRVLRRKKAQM